MGRVLYRNWANNERTMAAISAAIRKGCKIRILILDPTGPMANRRNEQEGGGVMDGIGKTLRAFDELVKINPPQEDGGIEIRLVVHEEMCAQVVRVDDYMWVQPYLFHQTGGHSASLEIEGSDSVLFATYQKEFDSMWKNARRRIGDPADSASDAASPQLSEQT